MSALYGRYDEQIPIVEVSEMENPNKLLYFAKKLVMQKANKINTVRQTDYSPPPVFCRAFHRKIILN